MASEATVAQVRARIEIGTPATAQDWSEARSLVGELLAWLEEISGIEPTSVQKGVDEELDHLPRFYTPPAGQMWVARVDGSIAATTGLKLLTPETAEIKRVYVRPAARGLGLASLMLDAALEASRQMGARNVVLETHPGYMPTAVAMYERRGFRQIEPYTDLPVRVPGAIAMGMRL